MTNRINCDRAEPWLSAFVDEQLPPPSMEQVARHVAGCERCGGEVQALSDARRLLAGLETPEPPDGYWARVYDRVAGGQRVSEPLWRRWATALALATPAVAAATIAVSLYLQPQFVPPPAPPVNVVGLLREHAAYRSLEPLADHAPLDYIIVRPSIPAED